MSSVLYIRDITEEGEVDRSTAQELGAISNRDYENNYKSKP